MNSHEKNYFRAQEIARSVQIDGQAISLGKVSRDLGKALDAALDREPVEALCPEGNVTFPKVPQAHNGRVSTYGSRSGGFVTFTRE